MLPAFAYVRPRSIPEAIKHLSDQGARAHAGGTDLLGCLRDSAFSSAKLVSLGSLQELRGIRESVDGLRIGALTTISEVATSPVVRKRYPVLAQAAAEVASPQLRNQGTIGGNLCQKPRCWYYRGEFHCVRKGGSTCFAMAGQNEYHCILGGDGCYIVHPSDTAPALVALGASVLIAGPGGTKTLPMQELYVMPAKDPKKETVLQPNEIITEILIPSPPAGLLSSYRKVRARRSWDFALASVALALTMQHGQVAYARVVLGGAAPAPWRSKEAEEAITGKRLDAPTIATAAESAVAKAQPMEHNAYKVALFKGLMEEQLEMMAG